MPGRLDAITTPRQTAQAAHTPRAGWRWWAPAGLALGAAYLALALSGPSAFGLWQDDAVYVVTAMSLADGQGYRHLEMPRQPLQTKYPPLFPAMLAGVMALWRDWPANRPALHAVTSSAGAALVLLTWFYIRRALGAGRALSAAVTGLAAVSPVIIDMNRFLMSELPYAALATGAMLVLDGRLGRPRGGRREWAWLALAGGLVVAAMMTRAFGLSLAGAGVMVLLWRRRWAQAGALAAMAGAALLAYGAWQHGAAGANGAIQSAPLFTYDLDYGLWIPRSWPELARVVWQNAARTVMGLGAFHLALPKGLVKAGIWGPWGATLLLHAVCWLTAALVLMGLAVTARRRLQTVHVYAAAYLAMMLAWPCEPYRFLVPWGPLVLYFLLEGGVAVAAWVSRSRLRPRPVLIGLVLLGGALYVAEDAQILSSTRSSYYYWGQHINDLDQIDEVIAWIRRNAPLGAVVAAQHTSDVYLATGRPAVQAWTNQDPVGMYYSPQRTLRNFYVVGAEDELIATYRLMQKGLWDTYRQVGVDYCVWDGSVRSLDPLRYVAAEQPEHFRMVFVSSAKTMVVYQVLNGPSASSPQPPPAATGG